MDRLGGTAKKVREYVRRGEYDEAIRIAERLNYDKVTNLALVMDVATAYDAVGDQEEAKDILLRYYSKKGGKSRNLMEFLIELCIVTGDVKNGTKYCLEFEEKWPEDPVSLVMRYRIVSAADGSLEEQAKYLEQYKKYDFDERWGYELAEVYYHAKQLEPCVKACHDLILYFGKGEYVERAAKMKNVLVGLSPDEIETLRRNYPGFGEAPAAPEEEAPVEAETEEVEEEWPDSIEAEIEAAQAGHDYVAGSDEELAQAKSQYYVDEKLKQTEEKARQRKLKEQQEEERRRAEAERAAAARDDMISEALHTDYYEEVEENRKKAKPSKNFKPVVFGENDYQKTVNELLHNFREALKEELGDHDVEYITVGRNSESYAEAIEERIRSEITMLSEEQVRELNRNQVKELHELTILHDVNNRIAALVKEAMTDLPDVDMEVVTKEMDRFIREDALNTLVDEMNAREAARLQAEEEKRLAEEYARKQAEAEAERRAREANIAKMEEEARRKRAEAQIQEALAAQEAALKAMEEETSETEMTVEEVEAAMEKGETEDAAEAEAQAAAAAAAQAAWEMSFFGTDEVNAKAEESVVSDDEAESVGLEEGTEASEDARTGEVSGEEEASGEAVETTVQEEAESKSDDVPEEAPVVEPVHTILDEILDEDSRLTTELFEACVVAKAKTMGYTVDDRAHMTIQVLCDELLDEEVKLTKKLAILMAEAAVERCRKGTGLGRIFGFGKNGTVLKDRHFDWDDKMIEAAKPKVEPVVESETEAKTEE